MKTIKLAVLAALSLAASSALADGIKGSGRYGTAGCGLGSLIFENQQGGVQILAATTNNIIIPQTFAITTGTSNCQPGAFADGTRNFVDANRMALAKDAARGQGDAIGAIAVINGCRDVPGVGAALQRDFKAIFPSEQATTEEITQALLRTLGSDPALGCATGT